MNKKGYTTGVFDLFHVGHLNLLQKAKKNCDTLIVAVCTDELVFKLKARLPVIPYEERAAIVKHIKGVDMVVPETFDDKLKAWEALKFDIIFKGDDWKGSKKWSYLEKNFRERGVEVIYLPYTQHTSSTQIRKIIEAFDDRHTHSLR